MADEPLGPDVELPHVSTVLSRGGDLIVTLVVHDRDHGTVWSWQAHLGHGYTRASGETRAFRRSRYVRSGGGGAASNGER